MCSVNRVVECFMKRSVANRVADGRGAVKLY